MTVSVLTLILTLVLLLFKYKWKLINALPILTLIMKNKTNNTMYIVQELHTLS